MPDYIKISELPAASSVASTDQLETNQAGTSRRITVSQLSLSSGLALYSSVAGTGSTNALTVLFPTGAKRIDLQWYLPKATFTDSNIILRGVSGTSTPITGSIYTYNNVVQSAAVVQGESALLAANWPIVLGISSAGLITFSLVSPPSVIGQAAFWAINAASSNTFVSSNFLSDGLNSLTGFQFSISAGNFAAAAFVRCYAVL